MKAKTIGCVAVVMSLLAASVLQAEEDNEEWIRKHAVIKTTESTERDAVGNIRSRRVTNDTIVYIRQTTTEIQKPDKSGAINTVSRTTSSVDTLGGSATIIESLLPGASELVTTSITTIEKTPEGTLTTVYGRDKAGKMSTISRTTSITKNNGIAPTVVAQ